MSTISSQRAFKPALHHPICIFTTLVALIYPPESVGDYLDPKMDTNTKKNGGHDCAIHKLALAQTRVLVIFISVKRAFFRVNLKICQKRTDN